MLRLAPDAHLGPTSDDLLALADAVREAAQPRPAELAPQDLSQHEGTRRGHLRSVRTED